MSKPKGYLRDEMPECAAFIDWLRDTFGADQVDPSIKAGMSGIPNKFHATERGQAIGTPFDHEVRR
jgi:hypothetical protein